MSVCPHHYSLELGPWLTHHQCAWYKCTFIPTSRTWEYIYCFSTSAPTGPPLDFTVIQHSARNMTFSWSPPAPTERNGAITGYSLSCVPEGGGGNSITMQYTAAGTFTLRGFTPFTSYNCSIFARNSEGSGPATYVINATLEAREWGCLHKAFFALYLCRIYHYPLLLSLYILLFLRSSWCSSTKHHSLSDWWFSWDFVFLLAASSSKSTEWDDHRIHHNLYSQWGGWSKCGICEWC